MSKQDPVETIKFLVCCIGHTVNGRPDFQAVATDFDICSKAAAQKRYERILKGNGVKASANNNGGGGVNDKAASKTSPYKRKAMAEAKAKKPTGKKPKSEPDSPAQSETPVKTEVKEEDDQSVISDTVEPDSGHEA